MPASFLIESRCSWCRHAILECEGEDTGTLLFTTPIAGLASSSKLSLDVMALNHAHRLREGCSSEEFAQRCGLRTT